MVKEELPCAGLASVYHTYRTHVSAKVVGELERFDLPLCDAGFLCVVFHKRLPMAFQRLVLPASSQLVLPPVLDADLGTGFLPLFLKRIAITGT